MSVQKFTWDKRKEKAAAQLAAGDLTDDEIAKQAGITRQGLVKWKRRPEFQERVRELVEKAVEQLREKGIADKSNRIAALVDRQKRMSQVIEARAEAHADVPGGATGLLVKETRFVKVLEVKASEKGSWPEEDDEIVTPTKSVRPVDYYAVDTGLLREMRETEKQAAQEIGDWTEKYQVSGDRDNPLVHELRYENLKKLPPDELARLYRESLAAPGEAKQP